MPYDGLGFFSRLYSWATDKADGIPITASRFDAEDDDFAGAFNNVLTRDGQGKPSANINWNNHRITNLADPVSPQDAANLQSVQSTIPGENLLINGGMEVWQQGTVVDVPSSSTLYTCDGAYVKNGANQHIHVNATTGLIGGRYSADVVRLAGETGAGLVIFGLPLDEACQQARNQRVSFSCLLTTGSTFSPTNGRVTATLYAGNGTPRKRAGAPFTTETVLGTASVDLGVGSPRTVLSFTSTTGVPALTSQMEVALTWSYVGTAGAADSLQIDDCQLIIGMQPGPFPHRALRDDLAACYSWFWKTFPLAVVPVQNGGTPYFGFPQAVSPGQSQYCQTALFPVEMRATPTLTLFNPFAANALVRNVPRSEDCTTNPAAVSSRGFRLGFTGSPSGVPGDLNAADLTADARV